MAECMLQFVTGTKLLASHTARRHLPGSSTKQFSAIVCGIQKAERDSYMGDYNATAVASTSLCLDESVTTTFEAL